MRLQKAVSQLRDISRFTYELADWLERGCPDNHASNLADELEYYASNIASTNSYRAPQLRAAAAKIRRLEALEYDMMQGSTADGPAPKRRS